MNIWETLGIAETTDIRKIKSAYASKAKEFHPEECPEEFQRLNNAYKCAISYAKKQNELQTAPESQIIEEMEKGSSEKSELKQKIEDSTQETQDEKEILDIQNYQFDEISEYKVVKDFQEKFNLLADDPILINNTICWKCFLEGKECVEMVNSEEFPIVLSELINSKSGWKRKTIRFFREWVEVNLSDKRKIEIEKEKGKKKRITKSQKNRYIFVTKHMTENNKWINLNNEADMKKFLDYYFEYAESQKSNAIADCDREVEKKRKLFAGGLIIILILLVLISCNAIYESSDKNEENYKKNLVSNRGSNYQIVENDKSIFTKCGVYVLSKNGEEEERMEIVLEQNCSFQVNVISREKEKQRSLVGAYDYDEKSEVLTLRTVAPGGFLWKFYWKEDKLIYNYDASTESKVSEEKGIMQEGMEFIYTGQPEKYEE